MINVDPIQAFDGFGTGAPTNPYAPTKEYFYSQGMHRSQFGIVPGWNISADVDNSILTNLVNNNWFAQGNLGGTNYIYAFDSAGRLYRTQLGFTSWSEQRFISAPSSHGNGLIFDQKNRLLYANDQWLGMSTDGSAFTDLWKDFTLSTTDFRPMDTYEDWVVIGNKNQVALLNVTDDSFNANALNLPSGFNIRCIKSGKNGILIGANFNNRGVLLLWDAFSVRSIAPWIWRNRNIQSIVPTDVGWIVITQQEILLTDGYSVQPILSKLPDNAVNSLSVINSVLPQGADVIGGSLAFWGQAAQFNRQQGGLYILNLTSKLFEFVPVSNGCTVGITGGAIFFDNSNSTHLSYITNTPNQKFLGRLGNSNASRAIIITEQIGQTDNEKTAEGVKLSLGVSSMQTLTPNITFDISVKVSNARRNIFGWGVTNATSGAGNLLQVDGSISSGSSVNKGQAGDEVTILEGVNAGQVRHILSIANQGTNTETWTLDSALPNNTEGSIHFNVSPFKLARKFSLSNISELKELYFDVQNKIKGKKFFAKILLENLPSGFMPEIKSGQFIYDDLGVKR
jgi:hypothetical protein